MRSSSARELPSPLLAIADAGYLGSELLEKVCAARRGGLEWVLLRAKGLTPSARVKLAGDILERCPGIALSVHTGPEIEGAWGLHLASDRLPAGLSNRRAFTQDAALPVGYSCHDGDELRLAKLAGAAYCLLSPVFAPTSKESRLPPLGWSGFERLAVGSATPLYALGGMTPERAARAADAGAAGVAVLGNLFGAKDIEASAARWQLAVQNIFT